MSTEISQETVEDLQEQIIALSEELRRFENHVSFLTENMVEKSNEVLAPEKYRKFKHKDTGTLLCTQELNPGKKWKRVCKSKTWKSQGECDRDSCKS